MSAVILDANALLLPFQFRVNLEAELRRLLGEPDIYVPSPVLNELKGLVRSVREARGALKLAGRFRVFDVEGAADDAVLEAASKLNAAVVSNDAALLRRLKDARIPRIFLRSQSHLVVEGL